MESFATSPGFGVNEGPATQVVWSPNPAYSFGVQRPSASTKRTWIPLCFALLPELTPMQSQSTWYRAGPSAAALSAALVQSRRGMNSALNSKEADGSQKSTSTPAGEPVLSAYWAGTSPLPVTRRAKGRGAQSFGIPPEKSHSAARRAPAVVRRQANMKTFIFEMS